MCGLSVWGDERRNCGRDIHDQVSSNFIPTLVILFPTLVILFPTLVILFPRHGNKNTKAWYFTFSAWIFIFSVC